MCVRACSDVRTSFSLSEVCLIELEVYSLSSVISQTMTHEDQSINSTTPTIDDDDDGDD